MQNAPTPYDRAESISYLSARPFITIEPILDFQLNRFVALIKDCHPQMVSIGADSGGHNLPEPNASKINSLILELAKFTTVYQKKNLSRIWRKNKCQRHQFKEPFEN